MAETNDMLRMCIPPNRLEVLEDIAARRARWALGPETKRSEDITILYDGKYFTEEALSQFEDIFRIDPNIWFITLRTKQGHELTIFEGMHPLSPEKE